jgi:hypothetical protein
MDFRANLGVTGGWKEVEYGVGVRTNGGRANSDYVSTGAVNGTDFAIAMEQAWFRYVMDSRFGDWNFTFGRQMNSFAYDKYTQNFYDNDVRFDGMGVNWKQGSFGLNGAWYILGGRGFAANTNAAQGSTKTNTTYSESADSSAQQNLVSMFGIQPHITWKFRDNIETMLAIGYYGYNKADGLIFNNVHGVAAGTNGFTAANSAADAGTVAMGNSKQWQIYNTWSLPYSLNASIEYVINNKKPRFGSTAIEADGKAYSVAITYGAIKKAHDYKVGYTYGSKDLGAVNGIFTNNRWLPDNKGHMLTANYALADNFELGWKGYFLKEKSRKFGNTANAGVGQAVTSAQQQKSTIWELTAGVNF